MHYKAYHLFFHFGYSLFTKTVITQIILYRPIAYFSDAYMLVSHNTLHEDIKWLEVMNYLQCTSFI